MTTKPELPTEQPAPDVMEQNSEAPQSSGSSAHDVVSQKDLAEEWKPSSGIYVAFLTLCVITLMVALDGTSLSVALPVSSQKIVISYSCNRSLITFSDHRQATQRHCNRSLLGRNLLSAHVNHIPAKLCVVFAHIWPEAYNPSRTCLLLGRRYCRFGIEQLWSIARGPFSSRYWWGWFNCADRNRGY